MKQARFKIRTLLVFMALCAIPVAYIGAKLNQKSAEQAALRELSLRWVMYPENVVDEQASLTPFLRENIKSLIWEQEPSQGYCRSLTLLTDDFVESKDSFDRLLGKLVHLKRLFIKNDPEKPTELGDCDLEFLDGMTQLTDFSILGVGISDLGYQRFGRLPLSSLSLSDNELNEWSMEQLGSLNELKHLQIDAVEIGGIENLANCRELISLRLSGAFDQAKLADLKACPKLTSLDLSNAKIDDNIFEPLLQLQGLQAVDFGALSISAKVYDRLVDAGLNVRHFGLTGTELVEDYSKCHGIYHAIDTVELSAVVDEQGQAVWGLDVATQTNKYSPFAQNPPKFKTLGLTLVKPLRASAGETFYLEDENPNAFQSNYFDGNHRSLSHHIVDVLKVENGKVQFAWVCQIDDGFDHVEVETKGVAELTSVCVRTTGKISPKRAKELAAEFFDMGLFPDQPEESNYHDRSFDYTFTRKD